MWFFSLKTKFLGLKFFSYKWKVLESRNSDTFCSDIPLVPRIMLSILCPLFAKWLGLCGPMTKDLLLGPAVQPLILGRAHSSTAPPRGNEFNCNWLTPAVSETKHQIPLNFIMAGRLLTEISTNDLGSQSSFSCSGSYMRVHYAWDSQWGQYRFSSCFRAWLTKQITVQLW